jgi:hypothetical protein
MTGIIPFFRGGAFDYDATKRWAKRSIACAIAFTTSGNPLWCGKSSPGGSSKSPAGGERDPDELCARALRALGFGRRQTA